MSIRRRTIERRATERLGVLERVGADGRGEPAAPAAEWADGADELLDALPPAQREAVRLRVLDELEYADVGARLGTSPAAARVRVHRGLAALRARLHPSQEASP